MIASTDPAVLGDVPERLARRRSSAAPSLEPPRADRRIPPSPVRVAGAIAGDARVLLDERAVLRARRHEVTGLAERAARLGRRAGARAAEPGAGRAAPVIDATGVVGLDDGAAAVAPEELLRRFAPEVARAEEAVRSLSAALTEKQAPRGRASRKRVAEAERLRQQFEDEQRIAGALAGRVARLADDAEQWMADALAANAEALRALAAAVPAVLGPLDPGTTSWSASSSVALGELRVGRWREVDTGMLLDLPCVVPFLGSGRSLALVSHDDAQRAAVTGLLRAVVVRLAALGRSHVRLTLLGWDTVGPIAAAAAYGATVPPRSAVPWVVSEALAAAERSIATRLPGAAGAGAPGDDGGTPVASRSQQVVVLAEDPSVFGDDVAAAVERLALVGPEAGIHVIVHRHRGRGDAVERGSDDGERLTVLDLDDVAVRCGTVDGVVELDGAPPHALVDLVTDQLRSAPPCDPPLAWHDLQPPADRWWRGRSDERVAVPLGRGGDRVLELWFGRHPTRAWGSDHALVTAAPGAGRSGLLRGIVMGVAVHYRPEDVRLSLVGGARGAELEAFASLPHVALVSTWTTPAQLDGIVTDLVEEVRRRRDVLARHGAADLATYRLRANGFRRRRVERTFERHLVVIDEIEQLLVDDDGDASARLRELVEHGGAVGVHLVLVARTAGLDGLIGRREVLARIAQRWSLAMDPDDLAGADDLAPAERALIGSWCDRPGRVVVNDRAGDDEAGVPGRLAWLHPDGIEPLVAAVVRRSHAEPGARRAGPALVVNGMAPPALLDDPHVGELLRNDCWEAPDFLEDLARTPRHLGGFGRPDWRLADRPVPLLLGQELRARRPAMAVLSRRPGQHLAVVGHDHGARVAMLAAALAGGALALPPERWEATVVDLGSDGLPGGGVLPAAAWALTSLGVSAQLAETEDEAMAVLRDAADELAVRRTLTADALAARPSRLLVLHRLDRLRELAREVDGDGLVDSPAGAQLRRLLVHGPAAGIHLVLATESVPLLRTVLTDAVVQRDVHHRVLMRAPEDDGFALVRSGATALLDDDGPPVALLFESDRYDVAAFRPFVAGEPDPLAGPARHGPFLAQFEQVCERLAARRR